MKVRETYYQSAYQSARESNSPKKSYSPTPGKDIARDSPREFVLKSGSPVRGRAAEELTHGRGDVPIGNLKTEVGSVVDKFGLLHAKVHEAQIQKLGYRNTEEFIDELYDNDNNDDSDIEARESYEENEDGAPATRTQKARFSSPLRKGCQNETRIRTIQTNIGRLLRLHSGRHRSEAFRRDPRQFLSNQFIWKTTFSFRKIKTGRRSHQKEAGS
jgi:hypothetical protein